MPKRTIYYYAWKMGVLAAFLSFIIILSALQAFAAEKTVGVIMSGNIPYYRDIHRAFAETLESEGLGPGKVEIILQSPAAETMSWLNAARKLVAVGSDVIVAYGAPATLSVMNETSAVPVVFAGVYDPGALGIKGKNITGISSKISVAGLLKIFKSISNFSTLGVVYSENEKDTILQTNEVKSLEADSGFRSVKFNVRKPEDISKIANVEALLLTTGCTAMNCVNNIVGIARKAKMPTATTIGGGESSGIILTMAANPQEQGREAAKSVIKIIKGSKPSSLPVQSPKKINIIINLREATDIGLKIPFDILSSATRVIK